MKKYSTEQVKITVEGVSLGMFLVPKGKASGLVELIKEFETVDDDHQRVSVEQAFADLYAKYGQAGSILRGLHAKEEPTQIELAEKLGVPQADISQIENGKRRIRRKLAQR